MRKIIIASITMTLAACSGEYVAKVGGENVTENEFKHYLDAKNIRYKNLSEMDKSLEALVSKMALEHAILKDGFEEQDTLEAEVDDFRRNLIINAYFEKYIGQRVTDEAVLNYFNNNSSEFEKEKARVAHILLRTNEAMSEEEIQAIKTRIYEVHAKIITGADFSEIAKKISDDTISGKKGGDLGWVQRGFISPVFSSISFDLESGAISEPIQTPFGFHIIKSLDAPKVVKPAFETVSGEIRHMLKAKAKQKKLDDLLSSVDVEIKEL
jgi:peptidyl-prolyl cis-trans isomerase C